MNNICERRIIVKGKGVRGNEDQNFILECEGGNDETKRKLIKIFLKTQKADVVCIQETKWKSCSKGIVQS